MLADNKNNGVLETPLLDTALATLGVSDRFEVNRGGLATLHGDVERDFLALVKAAQARGLYGGDVNEHVLTAILRNDEPISFGGVKPFNSAGSHN